MRIVFFGQSGPFAAAAIHQLHASLLHETAGAAQVVGVVEGPGSKRTPQRRRLFGHFKLGGPLRQEPGSMDLEVLAERWGLPHLWWERPQDLGATMAFVRQVRGEVAICVGFPFVWPDALLGAFVRALNVHPSLLPRWRGPSPLFWWLRSGEPSTGVSVHGMAAAADAGPIWARAELAPPWQTDGKTLLQLCGQLGARLVAGVLARGRTQAVAGAASAAATWAPRPRPEDAFLQPERWPAAALLRFAAAAPYFRTPSLVVAGERRFVAGAAGLLADAQIPGEFARCGEVLWVQAQGGAVGLVLQT